MFRRPYESRPKSSEKLRDYAPTKKPQPAAGKPSRPEEKSVAPKKFDEGPNGTTRPTAGKPSRTTEKPEKPKRPERDDKPKRGDQSPDSLDEDVHPDRMTIPDIISKIPLKEQCICELCTCG